MNTTSDEANCGSCGHVCNPARSCDAGACVCPTTCPDSYVQGADCTCACPSGFDDVNGGCFRICNGGSGVICRRFGNCTCAGSMTGSDNYLCTNDDAWGPACPTGVCPTGMACNGNLYCWGTC